MKQDEEMNQDADSQDNVPALMGVFGAVPFSQAVPFSARSSARSLTPVKLRPVASNVWHQDAVHGHAKVSEQLRPFCSSAPMLRLKRLKQLGICAETFPTAEHTRYQHSLAVGQLSRDFGKYLSQHLRQSAVGDLDVEDCRATPAELLQLELAGYAHDLGHGPYSHLWEKFMKLSQQPGDENWEHEDMSEKLLDLAVEEACEVYNLAEDHFLRNTANIAAAKNMIAGGGTDISPEKAWLYSIVCNKRSGLDTDKMDYLLRDQLNVFAGACFRLHKSMGDLYRESFADKPCKFQRREQLKELLYSARVVMNQNGETEIAIDMSCGTIFIERVNDVFQARAIMHEKVYQSGSVIANEELIVRLLRFVDPVFGYSKMSHAPTEFLALDDNIFDDIRRKRTDGMSEEHVKLVTQGKHMLKLLDQRLGPQHVQMARKVPSELTQGSTAGKIGEVVKERVMKTVWEESNTTEEQVWIKITDISEGRKDDKAVQFVTFFRTDGDCDLDEDGVELQTTRFTEESLRSQYGLRIEEFHGARMCFCHLLFWKASHDQEQDMQQLWEIFDKHWEAFKKDYEGSTAPNNKRKRLGGEVEVVPESDSE